MSKIQFTKYHTYGKDYHYQQINKLKIFKYNAFVKARYKNHLKLILKNIQKVKSKKIKILDVGCGDGVLLFLLKEQLPVDKQISLYGIDADKKAVQTAGKKIPSANFKIGNVLNLKFKNNNFDIVISSDVIEHLQNQNKMLSEIYRVVKKDGKIIIGTPIRFTEKPQDKFHVHELFPEEFKKLGKKYFSSVQIIKTHSLLSFLIYKKHFIIFGKKIFLPFLFINLLDLFFDFNPFIYNKKQKKHFVYMFLIGRK